MSRSSKGSGPRFPFFCEAIAEFTRLPDFDGDGGKSDAKRICATAAQAGAQLLKIGAFALESDSSLFLAEAGLESGRDALAFESSRVFMRRLLAACVWLCRASGEWPDASKSGLVDVLAKISRDPCKSAERDGCA